MNADGIAPEAADQENCRPITVKSCLEDVAQRRSSTCYLHLLPERIHRKKAELEQLE